MSGFIQKQTQWDSIPSRFPIAQLISPPDQTSATLTLSLLSIPGPFSFQGPIPPIDSCPRCCTRQLQSPGFSWTQSQTSVVIRVADPSVGRQLVRVMVLMVRATTASTATVQCAVFVPIALQSRLPRKTSGALLSTGQCGEPLRGDGRLRPCRETRVVQGRAQRRDPTVGRAQPRRGDEDTRRLRLHGVDLRMSVAPVVVPRGR